MKAPAKPSIGNPAGFRPPFILKPRFLSQNPFTETLINNGWISLRSAQHVDKFIRDSIDAGVWAKLTFCMPFVGNNLTTAMTEMVSAAATNPVNLVEGDYSEATGIAGNGTTKYIDSGFLANALPATAHISVYLREDPTTTHYLVGVNGAAAADIAGIFVTAASNTTAILGKVAAAAEVAAPVKGFLYTERNSATDLKLYRNNVQIGTQVTNTTPAYPARTIFIGARNNDGAATSFGNKKISFVSIGAPLSNTERDAFYSIVQTLQTNLGRNV